MRRAIWLGLARMPAHDFVLRRLAAEAPRRRECAPAGPVGCAGAGPLAIYADMVALIQRDVANDHDGSLLTRCTAIGYNCTLQQFD